MRNLTDMLLSNVLLFYRKKLGWMESHMPEITGWRSSIQMEPSSATPCHQGRQQSLSNLNISKAEYTNYNFSGSIHSNNLSFWGKMFLFKA
jgi:hypothetical protein